MLFLVDDAIAVLIGLFLLTQVIVPIVRGTRLVPLFSKKVAAVQDEIAHVTEDIAAEKERHRLKDLQHELDVLKEGENTTHV